MPGTTPYLSPTANLSNLFFTESAPTATASPIAIDSQMVTLPQNLLTSPGKLYEDFETVGDWRATSGRHAANTTQFQTGTQSIKITSAMGGAGRISKTGLSWDLTGFGRISLWLYLHNTTLSDYTAVYVYLYTDESNYYWINPNPLTRLRPGAQLLNRCQADFSSSGSPDWANITRIDIRVNANAGLTVDMSVDGLYFFRSGIPAIMFDFDDGYASQYNIAFAKMKTYGMRGSLNLATDRIPTYLSLDNILEIDAAGWTVVNHTNSATVLTTLSESDQELAIRGGQTALTGWGLTKGKNYLAYPGGKWDSNTLIAMTNTGIVMGRGTRPTVSSGDCVLPPYHILDVQSSSMDTDTSLETAKGYVDANIARGSILPLHFHDIGSSGQWTQADFETFVDYVYSKRTQIYVITKDDFYNLQTSEVRVPRIQ